MALTPPAATQRPAKPGHPGRTIAWAVISLLVVAAFWSAKINWSALSDFPAETGKYLGLLFLPPDWSKLDEALSAMLLSVQMAWIGTFRSPWASWPPPGSPPVGSLGRCAACSP